MSVLGNRTTGSGSSSGNILSIKDAAYEVMEDAYRHASAQGQYPANARQIMYAARPAVLALTGDKGWKRSSYFTQELLPDFMEEHPELTAAWDVVFDDRGRQSSPIPSTASGRGPWPSGLCRALA